jgi:hypothetical protein
MSMLLGGSRQRKEFISVSMKILLANVTAYHTPESKGRSRPEPSNTATDGFGTTNGKIRNQPLPTALGAGQSEAATFPHGGKHQPPVTLGGKPINYGSAKDVQQTLEKFWPKNGDAKYNTRNTNTVLAWEQETREKGLADYAPRGTNQQSLNKVHMFGPSGPLAENGRLAETGGKIGVDRGEGTRAMRLDGDHGHPIVEYEPGLNTSFHSYVNNSVKKARGATKDSDQTIDATKSKIADIDKRIESTSDEGERQTLSANRDHEVRTLNNAYADGTHAPNWLRGADEYVTNLANQGLVNRSDFGFNRP